MSEARLLPKTIVAETVATIDELLEETRLLGDARRRARGEPGATAKDRRSGLLTGWSFLLLMVGWLMIARPSLGALPVLAACGLAHAVASLVEFEIGPGSALPTTPVLFASAFLVPAPELPLVALIGMLAAALVARMRDPERRERTVVVVGSAWHAVGPAVVFAIAGVRDPRLADWPVYLLALLAQFGADAAATWVRNGYGLGVPIRRLAAALRFTFFVDLTLAPLGLAAALAAPCSPVGLLFLAGPLLLLTQLRRDRSRQLDREVALGEAVSETAQRARTDVLTGLANRLAWEEALVAAGEGPGLVGVIMADVDGLKAANDVHGHDMGDRLIVAVGQILGAHATLPGALAARLGGDEFGILLPGLGPDGLNGLTATIRAALAAAPPLAEGVAVRASVGWGGAARGADLALALVAADLAVNDAKDRSGSRRR